MPGVRSEVGDSLGGSMCAHMCGGRERAVCCGGGRASRASGRERLWWTVWDGAPACDERRGRRCAQLSRMSRHTAVMCRPWLRPCHAVRRAARRGGRWPPPAQVLTDVKCCCGVGRQHISRCVHLCAVYRRLAHTPTRTAPRGGGLWDSWSTAATGAHTVRRTLWRSALWHSQRTATIN